MATNNTENTETSVDETIMPGEGEKLCKKKEVLLLTHNSIDFHLSTAGTKCGWNQALGKCFSRLNVLCLSTSICAIYGACAKCITCENRWQ